MTNGVAEIEATFEYTGVLSELCERCLEHRSCEKFK